MDIKDIKELIDAIEKTSIQKFEMEDGKTKIKISKCAEGYAQPFAMPAPAVQIQPSHAAAHMQPAAEPVHAPEAVQVDDSDKFYIAKSPIVGTFYGSSSPGSEAFVSVGSKVSKGDTLCIVEAMKIMNEIESEESGEIVEIFVKNEDIVEYGQPLMKIRRA